MARRCEAGVTCKRHPDHKYQPGVCPSCLKERLNNLLVSTSSSSSSSACQSPPCRRRHQRNASDFMLSFVITGEKELTKSRSIAFPSRITGDAKKKDGFWSVLLRSTSSRLRNKGGFLHSTTAAAKVSL